MMLATFSVAMPLAPSLAWRTVVEFGKLGGLLIEKAVAVLWYPMDYHKH
jgi:hypothetical protein